MLRVSEFVKKALEGEPFKPFPGVVLIWNLTNRCNLFCKHCYSSANRRTEGELSIEEIDRVSQDLKKEGVQLAILSGGEPLLREDVFEIARLLRERGIRTNLSTNGLLINEENVGRIAEHFDYVGVSIDGTPEVHDLFRGRRHSFEEALNAVRLCQRKGIKVGVRFTLTERTADSLPFVLDLVMELGVPKLYVSHLVYAGRGRRLREPERERYRETVRFLLRKAIEFAERGIDTDIVTGNNEADAVLLLEEFERRHPGKAGDLYGLLRSWGGNQSGVRLVNIDYRGNVKPDPFFPESLGNVREKSFSEIWNSNGLQRKGCGSQLLTAHRGVPQPRPQGSCRGKHRFEERGYKEPRGKGPFLPDGRGRDLDPRLRILQEDRGVQRGGRYALRCPALG